MASDRTLLHSGGREKETADGHLPYPYGRETTGYEVCRPLIAMPPLALGRIVSVRRRDRVARSTKVNGSRRRPCVDFALARSREYPFGCTTRFCCFSPFSPTNLDCCSDRLQVTPMFLRICSRAIPSAGFSA